jgi:hypothetical protein
MEKISNKLENEIFDERAFEDAVSSLLNDVSNVSSKAISTLKDNFKDEITGDIKSLTTFANEDLFAKFIDDAKKSYIHAVKFVPESEKNRIEAMYNSIFDNCINAVKDLQRLFGMGYHLKFDGDKLSADKEEISSKIRPNFLIDLSPEQRQYFTLMANAVNALNEMHAFEKEHGYMQFSFNGINQLSKYGYFRKVNPMSFYQKFDEQHFIDALKNGTLGVEKDD